MSRLVSPGLPVGAADGATHAAALELLRGAGEHPLVQCFPKGALVAFDHDLRYFCAGGLGLTSVGLSRQFLEGRTIFEVFPPEIIAAIEPSYRKALAGEESDLEVSYGEHCFLQRLGPLRDADGTVIGGMGYTQDVTESRRSEQARRESEERLREERGRLREAQTIGRVGSWELDLATHATSWSDMLFEIYGLDRATLRRNPEAARQCVHPDDRAVVESGIQRLIETGENDPSRFRVFRADDGRLRWLYARGQALYEDGRIVRLAGTVADVTEQVLAETEVTTARAFQQAVITAAPDDTFIMELATQTITFYSRDRTVLGMTLPEIEAMGPGAAMTLIHPQDIAVVAAANGEAADLQDGQVQQIRFRGRHANGQWRWLSQRVVPFQRGDDGHVTEILGVMRDVTDVVEVEEKLTQSALHDALTGLPNRELLLDRLEASLARAVRQEREIAVLFCDLDGFKHVNDTLGHRAGDAVLVEVARRLKAALREYDTAARVGGDEFVLIVEPWKLPGGKGANPSSVEQDRTAGIQIANRIVEALREPILLGGTEHVVPVSVGITFRGPAPDARFSEAVADEIIQEADAAMYRAKVEGKDRVEVFDDSMRSQLVEQARVEDVLSRALRLRSTTIDAESAPFADGQAVLEAAYQPIFHSTSGLLAGFEALARLRDPHGAIIPPDVFIPIAEETGLIHRLGSFMLDSACRQLAAWRRTSASMERFTISVNISALQAQRPTLGDDVRRTLLMHGLEPADLVLELTESALLSASDAALDSLKGLRAAGVGIAIDDFGTGYASLRYLATLPVSILKVDRSFTAGLPSDGTSVKIVNAVVGLADDLELDCVIEGVETIDQRAALPPGVLLQGWLTGRPQFIRQMDLALVATQGFPYAAMPPGEAAGREPGCEARIQLDPVRPAAS